MAGVLNNNRDNATKNFSVGENENSRIKQDVEKDDNTESRVKQNVTTEDEQITVQSLTDEFMRFINEFKDKNGIPIYQQELERVITEKKHIFMIDYRDLKRFNGALAHKFEIDPEGTIDGIVRDMFMDYIKDDEFKRITDFTIGIRNYDKIVPLSALDTRMEDRLITVEGVVTAVGEKKKKIVKLAVVYQCGDGTKLDPRLVGQDYLKDKPIYDKFTDDCAKRPIRAELDEENSVATVMRLAILQETPEEMREGQTVPEKLVVVLTRELIKALRPGDVVRVTGVLKTPSIVADNKTSKEFYLLGLGVDYVQTPYSNITLTQDDIRKIEEMKKNPKKLLRDILESVAPSVDIDSKVKEAVALSLFGGVQLIKEDVIERGDIHILIIGDPGIGKTRFLRSIRRIAPKSIYVSGENATKVGLSAGLVKDENTGEWMLQAGALALASGGYVLLDEIDKLNPQDIPSLREAMQDQTITVTKIISATLNAKTTIIAVGNPKGDSFGDDAEPYKYIDISKSILSRFDLVFTLKRTVDKNKTDFIVDNLVRTNTLEDYNQGYVIPPDLMTKLIVYARTNVNPIFTTEAKEKFRKYAHALDDLAYKYQALNQFMTDRAYGSMWRLSTAYARIQLKDKVDVEDVDRAYNMIRYSLHTLGIWRFDGDTE